MAAPPPPPSRAKRGISVPSRFPGGPGSLALAREDPPLSIPQLDLPSAVRRGMVAEPAPALPVPSVVAALLEGGLPRGRVSEVVGAISSGRTSLLFALLATATASHEVTAVVDLPNAFDPASARRAEIDLGALLWVRPPSVRDGLRCTELILAAGGFGLVVLDLDGAPLHRLWSHAWPRLARAAERSATALIVLAPHRLAGSFAALSIAMSRVAVSWGRAGGSPALFEGLDVQGRLLRGKLGPRAENIEFRMSNFEDLPTKVTPASRRFFRGAAG